MNELQVVINETPGTLAWNFEELKKELADQVSAYKTLTYTDETIGDAKKDVAALRKLSTAVEDRRKDIKKRWMQPYETLEAQAKELTAIINEPIQIINAKVVEYEARQTALRREEITAYMDAAIVDLPEGVADAVKAQKYNPRWEMKSVSKKGWKADIDKIAEDAKAAVNVLTGLEEEYRKPCMDVYLLTLDLARAMEKRVEMIQLAEQIREQERRRLEEAQRLQERARKEREEAQRRQEALAAIAEQERLESERQRPEYAEDAPQPQRTLQNEETEEVPPVDEKPSESRCATLRFKGDPEKINKVYAFARHLGLECEVLR